MTICWLRRSDTACATSRATISNVPPGGTGTTRRIGLLGYVSACASRNMAGEPAAPATKCKTFAGQSSSTALQFRVGFPLTENHLQSLVRSSNERHVGRGSVLAVGTGDHGSIPSRRAAARYRELVRMNQTQ